MLRKRFIFYPILVISIAFFLPAPVWGQSHNTSAELLLKGYKVPQSEPQLKSYKVPQVAPKLSFLKKSEKPVMDPSIAKQIAKVSGKNLEKKFQLADENLSFEGGESEGSDFDMKPRRATFPGGKDTLSQMDNEDPAEVNVMYRLDDKSSARLAINEQDLNSTTYAPLKKNDNINAAGVYLDMDVQEDLQLRVGGEVRNHETNSMKADDKSSQGASVGMKWSF